MKVKRRWDFDYKKISLSAARQAFWMTIMVVRHKIERRQMFSSSRCHPPSPPVIRRGEGDCASRLCFYFRIATNFTRFNLKSEMTIRRGG